MRIFFFAATVLLFSCGQNSSDKKQTKTDTTEQPRQDTSSAGKDTATTVNPPAYTAPGEAAVNSSLAAKYGSKWHVLNDKEASWMKDAFDYFIVPKRKENPDYPYIARGDYDADGKADTAAVVLDSLKSNYRIAMLMGNGKNILWEEDISEESAISTIPKSDIDGMDGEKTKKIRMKGDGVNVEYFEKAAFVLYWDKSGFKRIQTAD
jgi:hypothetical protein